MQAEQSAFKIVTFFSEVDYQGLNYTLLENRLHYCVNFTKGPLVVQSAQLFRNTVCDLYTFVSFATIRGLLLT